jgi:putative SOS response-associated peptidase YedK
VCGRYVRRSDKQKIAEYFHANPQPAELPMPGADYNIAPTTHQPIIRQSRESGEREMVLARWGLVPFCIIPATAFFEWEKAGNPPKKPYVFELADGNPIGFAGLWDAWKDREGHWLQSFAIVTTESNELMSRVHPRMPVILHPHDYDRWLDREETERLPLDLLRPLDSDEMEMFEANPKVGNVRNNGPELMRAAVVAAEDGELPL